MNSDTGGKIGSSQDANELLRIATQLAQSAQDQDQRVLQHDLVSRDFLLRLNAEVEYAGDSHRLRLRRIMDALKANMSPFAQRTILELTKSRTFTEEGSRADLLIEATAVIRPAPPEMVAFWDAHSQPEDGFTPLTILAMVENGSPAALALFERKMLDPAHEDDYKVSWMHSVILPRRNSVGLLLSCERLLKSSLPAKLQSELVDSLFDYQPQKWFVPALSYSPPRIESYTQGERNQVLSLGAYVLGNVPISDQQKVVVERMLERLR